MCVLYFAFVGRYPLDYIFTGFFTCAGFVFLLGNLETPCLFL